MRPLTLYIIIGLVLLLAYATYYAANGCYCRNNQSMPDAANVVSIKVCRNELVRQTGNKDSIQAFIDILNKSSQVIANKKITENEYTSEAFMIFLMCDNGDRIKLRVHRLNAIYYHMHYQKNGDFFKQCVFVNNHLSELPI